MTDRFSANVVQLGIFIQGHRSALNLNQKDLGLRCHCSQARISTLETGSSGTPSLRVLASLADALEVPRHEILVPLGYLT